jgi:hypothetical protein
MQIGFVGSLNGRLRHECADEHLFTNLNEARDIPCQSPMTIAEHRSI